MDPAKLIPPPPVEAEVGECVDRGIEGHYGLVCAAYNVVCYYVQISDPM